MGDLAKKARRPVVHYPIELENEHFTGILYGFFHENSNEYNVTTYGDSSSAASLQNIGSIIEESETETAQKQLMGVWQNDNLVFLQDGVLCKKQPYELQLNIFSRNSGILETSAMLNCSVIISGVGSVGSLVAMELARSGVGNFLLVDNDTLAYHNICRHQLGVYDVGKFKVNAIRERILQINPSANVMTHVGILEDVPKTVFDEFVTKSTLIVGCADNREGDLYANRIAAIYRIPFVSIGFWERAFAGEIFYTIPGEMPCYNCLFGQTGSNLSFRPNANRRFYTTEEDLTQTNFEPGISTDINFITTVGIKLIIDLLNKENVDFVPRLLDNLTQFTLICNTSKPEIGGEQAEIFSYPLQVTTSIKVEYAENCQICNLVRE